MVIIHRNDESVSLRCLLSIRSRTDDLEGIHEQSTRMDKCSNGTALAPTASIVSLKFGGIMNFGTREVVSESPACPVGGLDTDAAVADVRQGEEIACPSRRREARVSEHKVCAYSLCESVDGRQVNIEQGEVYCINRSENGILVLMGSRPRTRQLLELHVAETQKEYSLSLYEVQWTRAVPVETQGELFLAGCRLVFGASRYWAF